MGNSNGKCTHCGKDTGQIDDANRKMYCNEAECVKAFVKEVLDRENV